MPKLANLKKLVDSLEKVPEREASSDDIRKVFDESNANNVNVMSFRMEGAMRAMLDDFGKSQMQARNNLLKSVGEMMLAMVKDSESLRKKVAQLDKSLSGTQNTVSDAVKASEGSLVKALEASVKSNEMAVAKVGKMVSEISFPEPEKVDFSMLEQMLVALSEQVAEPRKVSWEFDIERDVNDRLTKVVARPMDAA